MGQDWSWPCTSRKVQNEKVAQSKFNFDFLDDVPPKKETDDHDRNVRLENLQKIEELIQAHDALPSRYQKTVASHKRFDSQTQQSVHSAFSFTEDSITEGDLSVLVLCESIDNFDAFVAKYIKKYNHEMIPSLITPHPIMKKAIVVFQSINEVSNFTPGEQHKFIEFEKDLREINNRSAYQILVQFLRQRCDQGLQYLGYYLDQDLVYHFIFYEKDSQRRERIPLEFQTLEEFSQEELEAVLAEAAASDCKIRGVITLIPNENSPKPLSFAIFEKKRTGLESYITVDIAAEALGEDGVSVDLSKKIELGCQSDNLELAEVITNHQDKTLYLIFSK